MRLWMELYDASETTHEIVDLMSVTINRTLGRGGDMMLGLGRLENRFADVQGRRVDVYADVPRKRLLMQGYVKEDVYSRQAGPESFALKVLDGLEKFKGPCTWRGLVYDERAIADVVRELVGRVSGWRARIDANLENETTSIRFDGVHVLDALKQLAEQAGLHLQVGRNANEVVFGALGQDSGLIIKNVARVGREVQTNPNLLTIEKIEIIQDSYEVVNYVEPLAGGSGDANISLRRATLNDPYPVEQVTLNGRVTYILRDTQSILKYGQVERIWMMEEAIPVRRDLEGLVNTANVLYGWAAAKLARSAVPKKTYRCTVRSGAKNILPGDKVYVSFHGDIYKNNVRIHARDVEGEFWVTRVSENYSSTGGSITLELSNTDEPLISAEETISDSILEQRKGQRRTRLVVGANTIPVGEVYVDYRVTDGTPFTFRVSDIALDVAKCNLTIKRADGTGPDTIRIVIDGEDKTDVLGGPFLGGGGYGDVFMVDIAQQLTEQFVQGEHTIILFCDYHYGNVEVTIELGELVASAV